MQIAGFFNVVTNAKGAKLALEHILNSPLSKGKSFHWVADPSTGTIRTLLKDGTNEKLPNGKKLWTPHDRKMMHEVFNVALSDTEGTTFFGATFEEPEFLDKFLEGNPTLGEGNWTVAVTKELVAAMQTAGIDVRYVPTPDEG